MANPTTNFGWQMPEPTDLVTDLPADFEVFGQAVDTDFIDLLGGTTGQILSKTSGTDLDFTWVSPTAGDITGVTAGIGISGGGTSGTVTVTNSMATAIDSKGDLIVGTGADAFSNLAVGANTYLLTADSAEATGLKWAAPASSGATLLATLSLSGSSTASGTISSAFRQYQIYIKNGKFAGGINSYQLRLNGDTASNYSWQTFLSKNANELNGSYSSSSTVFNIGQCETTLGGASMFGALIFINRPSDTDRVFINSQSIGFDGGNTFQNLSSGVYDNSAAITSVTLVASGSTFQGDAYIYGVN